MTRGTYLSLEEARKTGQIKQFAKENQSDCDESTVLETIRPMVQEPLQPKELKKTAP